MKELSRKPRRYTLDGIPRYCSPACGGGCTRGAHIRAVAAGKTLVKRLGKGWKSVVHENLGWHFRAVHEATRASMHVHGEQCYWVQTVIDSMQYHVTGISARRSLARLRDLLKRTAEGVTLAKDLLA